LAFCHYYSSSDTTTWYVVRAKCDLTNIKQSSKKREGMARLSTKMMPSIEKRGVIASPGTTIKHRSDDRRRSRSTGGMHVDACRKDRPACGSIFGLLRISPSELLNASYQYSNQHHQLEMVSIKTHSIRRAIDIETLAPSFRRQFAINNWLRSSAWRDDVPLLLPWRCR
jgi:hypothetical protein